jgi:hypothetical protein
LFHETNYCHISKCHYPFGKSFSKGGYFAVGKNRRVSEALPVALQNRESNMSFLSFLAMHYSAASNHTKTAKHSHSHLPSLDSQAVHAFLPSFFQQISLKFKPIIKGFVGPNFVWQNLYDFLLASSLLNPPRF